MSRANHDHFEGRPEWRTAPSGNPRAFGGGQPASENARGSPQRSVSRYLRTKPRYRLELGSYKHRSSLVRWPTTSVFHRTSSFCFPRFPLVHLEWRHTCPKTPVCGPPLLSLA